MQAVPNRAVSTDGASPQTGPTPILTPVLAPAWNPRTRRVLQAAMDLPLGSRAGPNPSCNPRSRPDPRTCLQAVADVPVGSKTLGPSCYPAPSLNPHISRFIRRRSRTGRGFGVPLYPSRHPPAPSLNPDTPRSAGRHGPATGVQRAAHGDGHHQAGDGRRQHGPRGTGAALPPVGRCARELQACSWSLARSQCQHGGCRPARLCQLQDTVWFTAGNLAAVATCSAKGVERRVI